MLEQAAVPVDETHEAPAMRSPGPLVIPLRRVLPKRTVILRERHP
jgi:hypothetical protein